MLSFCFFPLQTLIQYRDPPIDGSSLNDKVLGETSCGTLKRCSSLGFYNASEVCSLAQSKTTEVSYFTKRPCLSNDLGPGISNMHEQSANLKEHVSSVSLTTSNSTVNEKGISVLNHALQRGSLSTAREYAQSCKNVSTGKYTDNQTKSCIDKNATLHRHLSMPSPHLKFDTLSAEPCPGYSSTSDSKQDDLEDNLQKENPPTPTLISTEDFQTPMEISTNWIKSEESNLPSKREESTKNQSYAKWTPREPDMLTIAAQISCEKIDDDGARVLDDAPTCSKSHSSCELSSSDTNNSSLIMRSTDKEMDDGQIISQNVMNVGALSDDTTAHYNSQGQSHSWNVSSNPETGINSVFSLKNTIKECNSEVNIGSPQTPTDILEKESAQTENEYKDHSTHMMENEHKIDPDCKSSRVHLSSVRTPVTVKKRVGRAFKKRTLLKMAKVFSTFQEPCGNLAARSGKFYRDLKKIKTRAKKMQSLPMDRRKSCRTAITICKGKNRIRSSHAEIKGGRCLRKSQKVKHSALVPDCGTNRCVKSGKMSRHKIVQVCKASSGLQSNNFQKGSSTTNRLVDCSEDSLKTEIHNEKQDSMSQSSAKQFPSNTRNTLLKTPDSHRKDANVMESRKQTLWNKRNKENAHSTELNGDADFQLSLQSTALNSTGFHSCLTNAFDNKVKDERSRDTSVDGSVKASDKHQELLEQDVDVKNSLRESNAIALEPSPVQKVDGFTQYSAEDYVTTLNKDVSTVVDAVKSTKPALKYINCKYCRQSFRHISAYTVHQRIHTGEKPYRCELCGKNFAQLSKLKSHRNVHGQCVTSPCPCCGKQFSEKRHLIAHFTTHVKDSKQNNDPGQKDGKPDAPLRDPTHSKSVNCNIYNKFLNLYVQKIHKHDRDMVMSCKTCGKEFRTSSRLVVHEKTHWPVKPYACSICAKSFNRIKALKKHSQKHTGEMPFSCSHCDRAFCDLPALRGHQISKLCNRKQSSNGENCDTKGFLITHGAHGQVNTPMFFKCQVCKQLYQKWCQYTLHLQTHTQSPPYLCFACGQSYENASEVHVHCRICCQTSGEEVACGSSLSEIFPLRKHSYLKDSSSAEVYSLEVSKSSSLSSAGQLHENSQTLSNLQTEHLMPESSQCVKASRLPETVNLSQDDQLPPSPQRSVMTRASMNKSLECVGVSRSVWRFNCSRCGQRFKRYRSLCFHMQTHAPAFKYVCGHCGHSFERWNKLWLHQRIHRRKGRCYTCSQCNVRFHSVSSYKRHLLNHAEERPYARPHRPQTFAHEEGLPVPQCNFHQPARKSQCDVCARSFSNLRNLAKHSLLHNGAISDQCLLCNLSFSNNKSLKEHLIAINNPASFLPSIPSEPLTFLHKCNRCKSSFSTGDLLYAHQIRHARDLKSQVRSTQSSESESTSVNLEGTRSSTRRPLLSTLDLDAIPKESLFKYPHPDKLYVPSRLSRTSKSIPIIDLESGDEDLPQEASTDPVSPNTRTGRSGQNIPESSQDYSETSMTLESQETVQSQILALHMDTGTSNHQDKDGHNSPNQMTEFVETSVFLEGPTTTAENEMQGEIFECVDCCEKLGSLQGLYEHYFLHALQNPRLYRLL